MSAIARPLDFPGQSVVDWMTAELRRNPSYQVPHGYSVKNGQVVRDQPAWAYRHPWIFPAAGIGAGAAATALGPGAAIHTATAPAVAPASTAAAPSVGGSFANGGSALFTGSQAAGPMGTIGTIARTAGALAPIVQSLFGRGGNNSGQDFSQLLQQVPELRAALALQTRQAERQDPLHAAVTQLAMNLLPKSALSAYEGRPNVGLPSAPSAPPPSYGGPADAHQRFPPRG